MKYTKKAAICCAIAICLFWGLSNIAIAADKSSYANSVQVKLGAYLPTGDADDADYETGGVFGLSYNRYLSDHLVLEAGWDGWATDIDIDSSNSTAGNYSQENILFASGLALTLKTEYAVGPVDLFGGAGVGVYGVGISSEIDTARLGSFDKEEYETVLGGHLTAGANFNITSRFYLGLEGTYRITDDVDIDETVAGIPVEYEGNMSGFSVALTSGFRF